MVWANSYFYKMKQDKSATCRSAATMTLLCGKNVSRGRPTGRLVGATGVNHYSSSWQRDNGLLVILSRISFSRPPPLSLCRQRLCSSGKKVQRQRRPKNSHSFNEVKGWTLVCGEKKNPCTADSTSFLR